MLVKSKNIYKKLLVIGVSCCLYACGGGSDRNSVTIGEVTTVVNPATIEVSFANELELIREQFSLPAAGGMLLYNGETLELETAGLRNQQRNHEVSDDDLWHLGSITKSMTATVAARLVEQGLIGWQSTLADIFPERLARGNGQFDHVSLEQLLSHTSGLGRDLDWWQFDRPNLDVAEQRLSVVDAALGSQAVANQGVFSYSNLGFVVAGAMLEQVSGTSWENLMQTELFQPLGMQDVGFGAPSGIDSQPSGHLMENGVYQGIAAEAQGSDNPPVLGPAGTVHMSLSELAKYAMAHMRGELGESDLLSAGSFVKLHQEVGNSGYGLGWFINGADIFHDGSNNLWFAKLGISVDQQIVAVSVTNAGGDAGNDATDSIINTMLDRHFDR